MRPETKYKGSIKLAAIADALGWITEFEKSETQLKQKFGTTRIDTFHTWKKNVGGRFYGFVDTIRAGSYSDDTQLLLAVARSIKKDGSIDNNYFGKSELANWLDYARGGGRTVKTAANKIQRRSANWYSNFYHFKVGGETIDYKQSGANGAAMRVLPIALANLGNVEKIKEEIFCNSIVTHGHPRAILGAMLYGYAANQIIPFRPEDFNWENYITQIGSDFEKKFDLCFMDKLELKQWLTEWNKSASKPFESVYAETATEARNQLRIIFQSIKQDQPVRETLERIGCFDPNTKGSGIATVIAGIYLAAKFHDKPLIAIVESANALGADTDSIAAFTGGLVGALHGQGIIPEKWKTVQDIEYLDKIAERLLAISEDRMEEVRELMPGTTKSLNNITTDNFSPQEEISFFPLGKGKITQIDRRPTLTKGKYNLLIEAQLESGQSILISKLFYDPNYTPSETSLNGNDALMKVAAERLRPKTLKKLKTYIEKQKRLSKEVLDLINSLVTNNE